jgi:hypothetical protein
MPILAINKVVKDTRIATATRQAMEMMMTTQLSSGG